MEQCITGMKTVAKVYAVLYAVFTPEQKAVSLTVR